VYNLFGDIMLILTDYYIFDVSRSLRWTSLVRHMSSGSG